MNCKPEKDGEGYVCRECGYTCHIFFYRRCGERNSQGPEVVQGNVDRAYPKFTPGMTIEERIQKYIDLQPEECVNLDEALRRLEVCRGCEKFGQTHCKQDKGCDKVTMLVLRILKRNCEPWS